MKRIFLALLIGGGLMTTAQAQSKFSLGPNAGFGGAWISNTPNQKTKAAGNFGLSLVYSASEHFAVGADVKYSFEGAKVEEDNVKSTLDLNYVRIPVKAYYFFNGYGDRLRPKVGIGPSFGFLNSAKAKEGSSASVDVKSFYNTFDFGVTALAGLNYRLVSNTWFNADISYLHGISNIVKGNSGDDASHNRNLQLNVGVNFGL